MPRLRFQKAQAEKRDALLDAATLEFARHGYEDASINRILLAAGFSKGSFYYYFDDKPDLAVAVLERWAKRFENMWDDFPVPKTAAQFWDAAESLIVTSTSQLREDPHVTTDAMIRLGSALARHADVRERLSSAVVTGMMTKVVEIWKHGQDIGAVRDDMPVQTLLALVQDVKLSLVRLVLPHDRAATIDEIEAFSRLHLDLVRRISERR
ncbi:MAG TPA: TetR/AcrR family transcriptional regulator [Polyangiaceae bacterium]|jgi:AcrR family transcriptional regulator